MYVGSKRRSVEVIQCSGDSMNTLLSAGLTQPPLILPPLGLPPLGLPPLGLPPLGLMAPVGGALPSVGGPVELGQWPGGGVGGMPMGLQHFLPNRSMNSGKFIIVGNVIEIFLRGLV